MKVLRGTSDPAACSESRRLPDPRRRATEIHSSDTSGHAFVSRLAMTGVDLYTVQRAARGKPPSWSSSTRTFARPYTGDCETTSRRWYSISARNVLDRNFAGRLSVIRRGSASYGLGLVGRAKMPKKTMVRFGEEMVPAEEMEYEPLRESWNEYRVADGSLLRLKVVVSKIQRLEKRNDQGEPIYLITSTNVVSTTVPPELMRGDRG